MHKIKNIKMRYEKMKKIIALVLLVAVFATLGLTACGSKDDNTPTTAASQGTTGEAKAAVKTAKDGVLTMVTNAEFPPYEYYDGDKIVGIDAEVAQLIAEKLGLTLEIVDGDFNAVVPGVQSGKYDMGMAGLTVNEDRLKSVDFTTSYAKGIQVVIVKEDSGIQSIDDLAGKKIGVQETTTGDLYASDDFGEDNVIKYANGAVAVEALKAGKVDCVIIDNEPAKAYVAANEGLKILETSYADEDYAIAVSKDNPELKDAIDAALKELIADGSLQKIVDKYIPA